MASEPAQTLLQALCLLGFGIVLVSTFLINHFELFGLRQVYLYLRGAQHEEVGFRTPFVYKLLRHPLMLGFIIAFWATLSIGGVVASMNSMWAAPEIEHALHSYEVDEAVGAGYGEAVAAAIRNDQVAVNGIVQVEILAFAAGEKEREALSSDFDAFHRVDIVEIYRPAIFPGCAINRHLQGRLCA